MEALFPLSASSDVGSWREGLGELESWGAGVLVIGACGLVSRLEGCQSIVLLVVRLLTAFLRLRMSGCGEWLVGL
jgi:hypothetical protein